MTESRAEPATKEVSSILTSLSNNGSPSASRRSLAGRRKHVRLRAITENYRTAAEMARREMFSLLLNVMDLAVETCKSVQLQADVAVFERRLHTAKRLYTRAVARSSYYRMTPQDVAQLELRSARLALEISGLEKWLRDRGVESTRSADPGSGNVVAA